MIFNPLDQKKGKEDLQMKDGFPFYLNTMYLAQRRIYIKEEQFDFIRQTDIKHKLNIEV